MQTPPTTTTTPPPIRQDGIPAKLVKPWALPPQKTPARSYTHRILPASADVIEVVLDGRYLCPGLIDCHVHLTAVAGSASLGFDEADMAVSYFRQPFLCQQMLSRGFTSVRDTGGATLALKEAIADDVFPGPRAHDKNGGGGGGDCCQCGAQSSSISVVADGVPACLAATREQLRQGADFIKIMVGGGVASPTDRIRKHAVHGGRGPPPSPTWPTATGPRFLPPANQAKNPQVLARGVAALQAEQSREFGLRKDGGGPPERRGGEEWEGVYEPLE
ncbi:hypothetical protein NHJ13051_008149 [Beauveria bassiana]